jgi:pimeloyl-ACP methyl ester carboxylesterase
MSWWLCAKARTYPRCSSQRVEQERELATNISMPFVHSADVPIHYEVVGAGPTIVLVHGFACSYESNWGQSGWIDFLVALGRTVIGLDIRGHGESGKPRDPAAYDLRLMAGDVLAVMDAAGAPHADLMGYSMGGTIAMELMVHAPERFNSVIVGGMGMVTTPVPPEDTAAIVAALATDDVSNISHPKALAQRQFAESRTHDPNSLATLDPDMKALAACLATFHPQLDKVAKGALERAQLPLLTVVGEKDGLLVDAQRLSEIVPDAELVVLAGEDHASAVSAPAYKDAVAAFLQAPSARRV